jgi:hypothetical protein
VNRSVRLPCPRGDGGEVNVFLEPEPHDPRGEEGWWAWIWTQPGPRGGHNPNHCSAGHRLHRREVGAVLRRAVGAYLDYRDAGGGLPGA